MKTPLHSLASLAESSLHSLAHKVSARIGSHELICKGNSEDFHAIVPVEQPENAPNQHSRKPKCQRWKSMNHLEFCPDCLYECSAQTPAPLLEGLKIESCKLASCDIGKERKSLLEGKSARNLLKYSELPEWLKDNDHIHGSYRGQQYNFKNCFSSLTYVHNETVNIFSHLLG
eukprot:Sdes_comp18590_c0_seq1m8730